MKHNQSLPFAAWGAVLLSSAFFGCPSRDDDALGADASAGHQQEAGAEGASATPDSGAGGADLGESGGSGGGTVTSEASAGESSGADADAGDTTPPMVVSVTPSDGSTGVAPGPIQITFSEPIAPASASSASFILAGPQGRAVVADLTLSGNVVTLVPGPLGLGTSYELTITTGVRDLAGNALPATEQFRFTTRDGAWHDPVRIGGPANSVKLAVDRTGRAMAVWLVPGNSFCMHGSALFQPDSGWTGLPDIQQTSGQADCSPRDIQGDGEGLFVVTWTGISATASSWARAYQVNSGWAEIVNGVGGSSNQHVAVSHGHAWVMTTSLLLFGVFGAEYQTGGVGWRPFRQIYPVGAEDGGLNSFTPDGSLAPRGGALSVVMDDVGRATAVWISRSQAEGLILVGLRYSSGTWSNPEPIELLASDATVASVGLSGAPDGRALAIWVEGHATAPAPTLKVSSLAPGGMWTTPAEPWSAPVAGTPSLPRVAMSAFGPAMAVWLQTDGADLDGGTASRIWASTLAAGATGWSAPEAVSSPSVALATADGPIAVGSDDTGNGLAAWIDTSPTAAVKSARFVAGTGWTESGAISGTSTPTTQLQVAVDPWGRALAVWAGSTGDIWAARFE